MCGNCSCFGWSVTICKRTKIAVLTCIMHEGKAQFWPSSETSAGFRLSCAFQLLVQETQIAEVKSPFDFGALMWVVYSSNPWRRLRDREQGSACHASVPGSEGFPCARSVQAVTPPSSALRHARLRDPWLWLGAGELELAAEPMWLVRVLEAVAWKYSLGSFATHVITAG